MLTLRLKKIITARPNCSSYYFQTPSLRVIMDTYIRICIPKILFTYIKCCFWPSFASTFFIKISERIRQIFFCECTVYSSLKTSQNTRICRYSKYQTNVSRTICFCHTNIDVYSQTNISRSTFCTILRFPLLSNFYGISTFRVDIGEMSRETGESQESL